MTDHTCPNGHVYNGPCRHTAITSDGWRYYGYCPICHGEWLARTFPATAQTEPVAMDIDELAKVQGVSPVDDIGTLVMEGGGPLDDDDVMPPVPTAADRLADAVDGMLSDTAVTFGERVGGDSVWSIRLRIIEEARAAVEAYRKERASDRIR